MQLAWIGPELVGPGSAGFDLPAVALQYGSAAPLLCLSAVETVPERMGCIPEIDCPGYRLVHRTYQLDSAVLEVASSPAPQSQAVPAPPPLRCKKPGKRSRQRRHKGSIGIGVATVVPVDGRRAGRCKTG